MRLRMLVSGLGFGQLAGLEVDVIVALARAVDAIGPVQAGVEPLRRIRRGDLQRQHGAQLIVESLGVGVVVEIAALPAPIGPGAGKAIEHLLRRGLADIALGLGQSGKRLGIGGGAPEEGGDGFFLDLLQPGRDAGLAEILLRNHVGSDLRPEGRDLNVIRPENDRAVRVLDFADSQTEFDLRVGRLAFLGVAPLDFHRFLPHFLGRSPVPPYLVRHCADTLLIGAGPPRTVP
jgi:hypothetical protein